MNPTRKLHTLALAFIRAQDEYAITLSDDDRRKARKALLNYLKAGGTVHFAREQEKSA